MPLFRSSYTRREIEEQREYESQLKKLSELKEGAKSTEIFLERYPHMATIQTVRRLEGIALKAAMVENYEKMHFIAEQCIIVQNLRKHAVPVYADPLNRKVQEQFFREFHSAGPLYLEQFQEEVRLLENQLRTEAQTKREEAMNVMYKILAKQGSEFPRKTENKKEEASETSSD